MSPQEIVQKQLDFYNDHNLEGFISTYHDDITICNLIDNSIILQGKDLLAERYRERFEVLKVNAKLIQRIVIGNKVIDHEHVTGLKQNEITKAVAVYEIKENLITRVWFVLE